MSESLSNQVGQPAATKDASPLDGAVQESIERMRVQAEIDARIFGNVFESPASTKHYLKIANFYAASSFVPDTFKNKPGDCLIALDLAHRMGVHELLVMQNMHLVKGRPGWATKFMIARCNQISGFQSSITWDMEILGKPIPVEAALKDSKVKYDLPNLKVTAWALDRFGQRIYETVDAQMIVGERWFDNLKYRSMCERMMRYRSASGLINLYAPEVMMGLPTAEELEDRGEQATSETADLCPQEKPAAATATAGPAKTAAPAASTALDVQSDPGGHSLTRDRVRTLSELAGAAPAVSFQEYEELYGQPIDEMTSREGETEDAFFARLLADLNGLKDKVEKGGAAGGSLFEEEKPKKK